MSVQFTFHHDFITSSRNYFHLHLCLPACLSVHTQSVVSVTVTDWADPLQVGILYERYPQSTSIVQELCESRCGRPGLSVLTSLLVSLDVKLY